MLDFATGAAIGYALCYGLYLVAQWAMAGPGRVRGVAFWAGLLVLLWWTW